MNSRFMIAHEIAHTFQFGFTVDAIFEKAYFLHGSFEAEYFSNRIARSLLLPRKLLVPFYLNLQHTLDDSFSLKFINIISEQFKVSHTIVLQRLVNDLDLFKDIALLRFVKFVNEPSWRLLERYLSNKFNYNKHYFIPYRNRDKKTNIRYPSCGESLTNFLNDLIFIVDSSFK